MSTGSVVGSRQRALEARVSVLERELGALREEMALTREHLLFVTRGLDAVQADNRYTRPVVIRNGVSEE